jgi:hypothetical protein
MQNAEDPGWHAVTWQPVHTRTTFTGSEASSSSHFIKLGTQAKQTFSLGPRSPTPMMSPRSTHSDDGACSSSLLDASSCDHEDGQSSPIWARAQAHMHMSQRPRPSVAPAKGSSPVRGRRSSLQLHNARSCGRPAPRTHGFRGRHMVVGRRHRASLAEGFISY